MVFKRPFVKSMFLIFCCLLLSQAINGEPNKFEVQNTFHVSVTGSFRHDITTPCTYCDCTDGGCTWYDDQLCATRVWAGPDDDQQRWGTCPSDIDCTCFSQSGVGFQGATNITMVSNPDAGDVTRIGKITHYNNPIFGESPTQLRLTITMDSPDLASPFIIGYPLYFVETDNTPQTGLCDPSFQKTDVPCDDVFTFTDLVLTDSFMKDNIEYTLEIVGFIQNAQPNTTLTPIKQFVTEEKMINVADVYARIVTACIEQTCGDNQVFVAPPVCGCVCQLNETDCTNDNLYSHLDVDTCQCICTLNATDCPPGSNYSHAECSCGCPMTDHFCSDTYGPLYGVSRDPTQCECVCLPQKFSQCEAINKFFQPDPTSCQCVCTVSDAKCKAEFGSDYYADFKNCACQKDGGLGGGDIAGIVIGSVIGACLLSCCCAALAGLLAYLIRRGRIAGIYGVKMDHSRLNQADFSPLYNDPWKPNENLLGN